MKYNLGSLPCFTLFIIDQKLKNEYPYLWQSMYEQVQYNIFQVSMTLNENLLQIKTHWIDLIFYANWSKNNCVFRNIHLLKLRLWINDLALIWCLSVIKANMLAIFRWLDLRNWPCSFFLILFLSKGCTWELWHFLW